MTAKRENCYKQFVKVRADHMLDGTVRPLMFRAEGDDQPRIIDRVTDVREAPSLKAGGQGIRYICKVGDKEIHLYNDDIFWFIEVECAN